MKLSATSTLCAVLVVWVTAAPQLDLLVENVQPRLLFPADVPDPTVDDFYQAPAGFQSKANGAVLRWRSMTTYKIKHSAGAFQILYKTIDAEGDPDASVVTLVVPQEPVSPARLVSRTIAEDSAAPICAPSYQIRKGTGDGTGLEAYLAQGFWGVLPDHESSKSAAFVGPTEGPATLDAIRAAIDFQKLNVKTTQIGLTGYSGGAHAAAWAAQLSKTHAPELKIVAAAVGGVPVNPKNILLNLTKGRFAGFAAIGLAGAYNAYSDLRAYLDRYLSPKGREVIDELRTSACLEQGVSRFSWLDILSLINRPDPLNEDDPFRIRLAQNVLGGDGSISPIPTYIYHAGIDEIVSRPDVDVYVRQQCAGGARFTYVVDTGQTHGTERDKRDPDAQSWLIGRLNGSIPAPAAC